MRDTLVCASTANEMPITPKAHVLTWLVDFEAGVMLQVYDDTGMDVNAKTREAIEPTYRQFDAWLLKDNRARVSLAFV